MDEILKNNCIKFLNENNLGSMILYLRSLDKVIYRYCIYSTGLIEIKPVK